MTNDRDPFSDQVSQGGADGTGTAGATGGISLNKSPSGSAGAVPSAQAQQPASQQGGPSPWPDASLGTPPMGTPPMGTPSQGWQPGTQAAGDVAQKKLIAGLLGIFLGSLGIHKFYLGMNQPGIIMLALTVGGWLLFTLLAIILIGFVFLILPFAMGLIGLIEGILYLTKTDADFQREYIVGQKPWF